MHLKIFLDFNFLIEGKYEILVTDIRVSIQYYSVNKFNTARLNWLLRQLKNVSSNEAYITAYWPGSSQPTVHALSPLQEQPDLIEEGKQHLQAHSFRVFLSKSLGVRFTQQQNFIVDLEQAVPDFYASMGQNLKAWQKPAPKIEQKISEPRDDGLTGKDLP